MKYLLVSDGNKTQQDKEPSEEQMQAVLDEELQIFRMVNNHFEFAEASENELESTREDEEPEIELSLDWYSV